MKPLILSISIILSFSAKAQSDSLPKSVWKTTISPDRIVSVSLMLSKADGSIIIIDSAWKMNVRKELDKVAVIYPDSTRVIYRVVDRHPKDTLITIPFEISKKTFDGAQNIKLEIIR